MLLFFLPDTKYISDKLVADVTKLSPITNHGENQAVETLIEFVDPHLGSVSSQIATFCTNNVE